MAERSQNDPDLLHWLEHVLLQERCELELRHQELLTEFAERFGSARSQECFDSEGFPSSDVATMRTPIVISGDARHVPDPPDTDCDGQLPSSRNSAIARSRSKMSHDTPLPDGQEHASRSPRARRQSTILRSDLKNANPVWGSAQDILQSDGSLYQRFLVFASSPAVEVVISAVIFSSAVILGMEMQWRGLDTGNLVGYTGYTTTANDSWPWAETFFEATEMALGVFFLCELMLKIMAQRVSFFKDCWNWVDVLIVGSWMGTVITKSEEAFNPIILRLLRLMRLLRLLRLLGMISVFDSLYLMTTAIQGSLTVLGWAVLVLTVVEMTFACLLQSAVEDFLRDPKNKGTPEAEEVYKYYGSFARSMLTMFELTLGNWMPPTRALVEHVHEAYMIFFLMHKFVIGFSVVSVITGVFIQETFEVAQNDDQIMLNNKERTRRKLQKKMAVLFEHADSDGDGNLDCNEFMSVMHDDVVRKWLSSMGLDVDDAAALFEQLHRGDHLITADELLLGAQKLRGSARSIDLATLMDECRQHHALLQQVNRTLSHLIKEGECDFYDQVADEDGPPATRASGMPGASTQKQLSALPISR